MIKESVTRLDKNGYDVIESIYSPSEINRLGELIQSATTHKPSFRKSADLFAIRQFFREIPASLPLIFNPALKQLLQEQFSSDYFVSKSIYFDKPGGSNWFVAYHQDLTISVHTKKEMEGFSNWTVKQNQYAVQPPASILEDNFTIRIHLDNTTPGNGALKVIPKSHTLGIWPPSKIAALDRSSETTCSVAQGSIMLMKPLLLHASGRTTNHQNRRVIHIEFSRSELPAGLEWSEKQRIDNFISQP